MKRKQTNQFSYKFLERNDLESAYNYDWIVEALTATPTFGRRVEKPTAGTSTKQLREQNKKQSNEFEKATVYTSHPDAMNTSLERGPRPFVLKKMAHRGKQFTSLLAQKKTAKKFSEFKRFQNIYTLAILAKKIMADGCAAMQESPRFTIAKKSWWSVSRLNTTDIKSYYKAIYFCIGLPPVRLATEGHLFMVGEIVKHLLLFFRLQILTLFIRKNTIQSVGQAKSKRII